MLPITPPTHKYAILTRRSRASNRKLPVSVSVNPPTLILHNYFPTQKRNVFDSRTIARVGLEPTTFGLWDRQSDRWYISHLLKIRGALLHSNRQPPTVYSSDASRNSYNRNVYPRLHLRSTSPQWVGCLNTNNRNNSDDELTLCTCHASNHWCMENVRIELTPFCLQSRRSPNWANSPKIRTFTPVLDTSICTYIKLNIYISFGRALVFICIYIKLNSYKNTHYSLSNFQ